MKNLIEEIEVRVLNTIEQLEEIRALEAEIWGYSDSIPTHQTLTAVKNGGLVLGAFSNHQLIGFQYSFPGFNGQNVYLCSHILAMLPEYRNKGIGEKLKYAQREEAQKLGYRLITWTYDPLESINGYLNIGKLGGKCSSYIPNCYGEMEDLLNKGIPSDRFLVHWPTQPQADHHSLETMLDFEETNNRTINQWEWKEGVLSPTTIGEIAEDENHSIFVAIPKNYREIREKNQTIALRWRMKTREVFTTLFHQGYQVTGFRKNSDQNMPVNLYVLTKGKEIL